MDSVKESEQQKHRKVIFIKNLRVRRNCQLLYYIVLNIYRCYYSILVMENEEMYHTNTEKYFRLQK